MKATPHNTAVVGIMAYTRAAEPTPGEMRMFDYVPETVKLYEKSAAEMGIQPHLFRFTEFNPNNRGSFFTMVTRFAACLEKLQPHYEYILYADTRDVLFVRPLDEICWQFNGFDAPLVMGAEPGCWPDKRERFAERFPKLSNHHNDYPNCGVWMARRSVLKQVFIELENLRAEILDGKHDTDVKFHDVAQYVWQNFFLTTKLQAALDYDSRMISNYSWTGDAFKSCGPDGIVISADVDDRSCPSIIHFPGGHEEMMKDIHRKIFVKL